MKARDIMTTTVISAEPDTSVREIARLLLKHRISAVPVVGNRGRVIGMVSEGDLIRRPESRTQGRGSGSWWLEFLEGHEERARTYLKSHGLTASDVMSPEPITVTETASLEEVASLLEKHHIKRVPVLRGGKLVGIVSRANLLHGLVARDGKAAITTRPDTAEIRDRVMLELRRIGLRTDFVNVVVADGIVHLWGLVESAAERKAVALAARRVAGVKKVENQLSIQPVSTFGWE